MLKCLFALALFAVFEQQASAAERVRVAVFNNPPLMTYDARDHRAGGIFMDVLRYTAAREGWQLEEVPGEPGEGYERLQAGEVDLLSAIPFSKGREGVLTYSREPLATSWGRIYVRRGSTIQTLRDLAGKTVAHLKGSVLQEQLLRRAIEPGSGAPPLLLEYANFEQAFRAVADGRAEAVLTNRFTGTVYARHSGLRATRVVLAPYGFRFAARPDSRAEHLLDALDRNLLLLKTDPESFYYSDLEALEDSAREFSIPTWVYWAAAAGFAGLAIAFAWALCMRRAAARVARSEAKLRQAHGQLQLAHEELHRINTNSLDVIAVLDADFIVRRLNPASEKWLGAPVDRFIGQSALNLVPPERRHLSRQVLESVRAGNALQGHASEVQRQDGTVVPFLWSLTWSEQSQEIYAIGHDDTERHRLILNLQIVNRDLQTFAQSVSHDLRSPVVAVVGFVGKVLRDDMGALPQRSRELLTRAHAAGQRMDGIIENLLRLARVTAGGVQRRHCDISAMCQEIVATLRNAQPDRAVIVDIAPGMQVHADRELLRHVFENLLSNAWKFTRDEPQALITVHCEQDSHGPVFVVGDNGAGFDMAYAHNLFVPFGRLHKDEDFSGVGIGLSVVHRVVTAHGGRIWAQGEPGAGAAFRFNLGDAHLVFSPVDASSPPCPAAAEALTPVD